MPDPSRYDEVPYVSSPMPLLHPDRLAAQARLFGQPPPAGCRYLEVGGWNGTNLIAAAVDRSDGEFVGPDLSAAAVAGGNALVAELGLTNVRLHQADLTA